MGIFLRIIVMMTIIMRITMINHQAKMDILLSSCGTNQFSCSDGACIDLHMRCDLFPDCDDKVCTVINMSRSTFN